MQTLAARYLVRATNLGLFLIHQEPEVGHAKPQNYIFLEADAPHTSQTTFARMCGGEHWFMKVYISTHDLSSCFLLKRPYWPICPWLWLQTSALFTKLREAASSRMPNSGQLLESSTSVCNLAILNSERESGILGFKPLGPILGGVTHTIPSYFGFFRGQNGPNPSLALFGVDPCGSPVPWDKSQSLKYP